MPHEKYSYCPKSKVDNLHLECMQRLTNEGASVVLMTIGKDKQGALGLNAEHEEIVGALTHIAHLHPDVFIEAIGRYFDRYLKIWDFSGKDSRHKEE